MTKILGAAALLCVLVGCASPKKEPISPNAAAGPHGGGPRDTAELPASPYNSVGGMNDDGMNQEAVPQGDAPRTDSTKNRAQGAPKR